LACLAFLAICAAMGGMAVQTQSALGSMATNIYDRVYLGTIYIARAQIEFLHFRSAHPNLVAVPASAAADLQLTHVLEDLDIAVDRAMSEKTRLLCKALHGRIAELRRHADAASISEIDIDLARAVRSYDVDGLRARDDAEHFVSATNAALRNAVLFALGLSVIVGMALDQAVIPSLQRGVKIAREISAGNLTNVITARGRSETATLLRALATMQAAILANMDETKSLHAAELGRQQAHESELASAFARLRELSDSTFEGLLIHRDGAVLDANTAFCDMFGLSLECARGRSVAAFAPGWEQTLNRPPRAAESAAREIEMTTAGGATLPVEVQSRGISYAGGDALVTAVRDVRERLAAERRIRFMAHHDLLTGLANRFTLNDALVRVLATAQRVGHSTAIFCIDLDRFKVVNDTLGHPMGDLVLQQVAARLQAVIRDTDIAARIGGDEFVVVQTMVHEPSDAACLAKRLVERLSDDYDLNGQHVCLGATIGIAIYPQNGTEPEVLIRNADLALNRAKSLGRGLYHFFEEEMGVAQRNRVEMERDLAEAIAAGSFELAFQPLLDAKSEEVVAFEALIRWPHPTRGLIQPSQFIALAEYTGLIVPIGRWVLESACRAALTWNRPCKVSVNISPRQIRAGDLPAVVADILARTGLPACRLELEVTENILMDDEHQALMALTSLKQLGLHIVLDDFGTGYSSLSYLHRFRFDKIKIDKSFVQNLAHDRGARTIVRAILAMAHQLDLLVTAEGVETDDQLALLRSADCDEVQGFLLGPPMQSHRVNAYLRTAAAPTEQCAESPQA
jgi:diguanylate cyclase (GGDEF)-like protein/PAS domain S-box-containing protein